MQRNLNYRVLREFPELVRVFGLEAVKTLLTNKTVDIHCEGLSATQIGQFDCPRRREKGFLPYGSYAPTYITHSNREGFIHDCLQRLHEIKGLHTKEVIKLKREVVSCLLKPNPNVPKDMMQQFKIDLGSNVPAVKNAVAQALHKKLKAEVRVSDFSIQVHQVDDEDFRTESNISKTFRLTELETHQVVERGLLAVGELNQRIAEMKAFTALSGFRDVETPLFDQKLNFLSRAISPDAQGKRFRRVLIIGGFQDLEELVENRKVDLVKLLEVRETRECQEFRDWLWSIDSTSDAEIGERIKSLRDKLSWFAQGKGGKTFRWLASTGIGLIPVAGNIAGAGAGFLDTFLLDKVLPGPLSFLNNLYPSIFKENPMITPDNFLKIK